MKIFQEGKWGHKVNFVDENNVVLGFDNSQSCCESYGWFFHPEICNKVADDIRPTNLEDYSFDSTFFQENDGGAHDCGGIVIFKIASKSGEIYYLHLYNFHNGYYSHGFQLNVGGEIVQDGSI